MGGGGVYDAKWMNEYGEGGISRQFEEQIVGQILNK